jgi:hypothetical protein
MLWLDRKTREEIHSLARICGVNLGPPREMSVRSEQCEGMRDRSKGGSKTKPIAKNERVEANGLRDRQFYGRLELVARAARAGFRLIRHFPRSSG